MPEIVIDPRSVRKDDEPQTDPKAKPEPKESPRPDTKGETESTKPTGPKDPKQ